MRVAITTDGRPVYVPEYIPTAFEWVVFAHDEIGYYQGPPAPTHGLAAMVSHIVGAPENATHLDAPNDEFVSIPSRRGQRVGDAKPIIGLPEVSTESPEPTRSEYQAVCLTVRQQARRIDRALELLERMDREGLGSMNVDEIESLVSEAISVLKG